MCKQVQHLFTPLVVSGSRYVLVVSLPESGRSNGRFMLPQLSQSPPISGSLHSS